MTNPIWAPVMSPYAITPESAVPRDANRKAWQREMEKIQMESWFNPPVLSKPNGIDLGKKELANIRPVQTITQPISLAFRAVPENIEPLGRGDVSPSADYPDMAADLRSVLERVFGNGRSEGKDIQRSFTAASFGQPEDAGCLDLGIDVLKPCNESALQRRQPVPIATGTQGEGGGSPSIRVHAEWQGSEACVWLGVDVGQLDLLGGVNRLALELQQTLAQSGRRLTGLVCNGREVFRSGDQETQAPGLPRETSVGQEKPLDKLVNSFLREK